MAAFASVAGKFLTLANGCLWRGKESTRAIFDRRICLLQQLHELITRQQSLAPAKHLQNLLRML